MKPFVLDEFIKENGSQSMTKKVTKKELKHLADELGLAYDDAQIIFARKLLNAYGVGK